jgi:hypothetical protein
VARTTVASNSTGSLQFKGGFVNLSAPVGIGTAASPVRVAVQNLIAISEGQVGIQADGDVDLGTVASLASVTVRSTGSIRAGVSFLGSTDPANVNVYGFSGVNLSAAGTIGTPARSLRIAQDRSAPQPLPTGPFIVGQLEDGAAAPPDGVTVGLVDALPVSRPTYVPPSDGDLGNTVGTRDNVLLPSLRGTFVKTEGGSDEAGDGTLIKVVRRDSTEDGGTQLAQKQKKKYVVKRRR